MLLGVLFSCAEDRDSLLLSATDASSSTSDTLDGIVAASKDTRTAAASQQTATQGGKLDASLFQLARALGGEHQLWICTSMLFVIVSWS